MGFIPLEVYSPTLRADALDLIEDFDEEPEEFDIASAAGEGVFDDKNFFNSLSIDLFRFLWEDELLFRDLVFTSSELSRSMAKLSS